MSNVKTRPLRLRPPKEHEFLCKLEAAGFELVGVIGDGFDRRELYFRGPTHGHRVTVELNPKEAIKVERWDLDVFDEYSTFWIQRAIYLGSVF